MKYRTRTYSTYVGKKQKNSVPAKDKAPPQICTFTRKHNTEKVCTCKGRHNTEKKPVLSKKNTKQCVCVPS
jgi:hypothetical protein